MKKIIIFLAVLLTGWIIESCNNNQDTPATAGTHDSSGLGGEKGKGTPYGGDSAAQRKRDSLNNLSK